MPQWRPSWEPKSSIAVPCSDGRVTTTSWLELASSWLRSCATRRRSCSALSRSALSTTRLVRRGNSSAASACPANPAALATTTSSRTAAVQRTNGSGTPAALIEVHLRRLGYRLGLREGLARRHVGIEDRRPDAAGEGTQLGVVDLDRLNVVAPRHRDAIFGALELRLDRTSTRLNSSH